MRPHPSSASVRSRRCCPSQNLDRRRGRGRPMSGPSAARILGLCCRGHPRTQGEMLAMAQRAPLQAAVFGSDAAAFSPRRWATAPVSRRQREPAPVGWFTARALPATARAQSTAGSWLRRERSGAARRSRPPPRGMRPHRVRKVSVAQVSAGNESRARASATVATSRPVWRTRVAALATNSPFDFAITPEGR